MSVIICTKDRPEDIKDCLNSLKLQTYQPDEIIVVDASGDNQTEDVCLKFQVSMPLKYIRFSKSNPHLCRQRNIGLENSQGDIICFLDDDVILDKDYLKVVKNKFLDGFDGCTGYDTNMQKVWIAKRLFLRLFMLVRWDGKGKMQPSGYPARTRSLEDEERIECIVGASSSYRRKVFDYFRFNEELLPRACAEDIDFSHRASKIFNFVYSPKIKYFHKRSEVSRPNKETEFFNIIYFHYYFYRNYLPKKCIYRFCFWWSNLGDLFRAIYQSVKYRQFGPLFGYTKAQFAGLKLRSS